MQKARCDALLNVKVMKQHKSYGKVKSRNFQSKTQTQHGQSCTCCILNS